MVQVKLLPVLNFIMATSALNKCWTISFLYFEYGLGKNNKIRKPSRVTPNSMCSVELLVVIHMAHQKIQPI